MFKLDSARKGFRPAFAWAFVFGWIATLATVLALLATNTTSINDATAVLLGLFGSGGPVAGIYTWGRTRERVSQVEPQEYEEVG